MKSHTGVSNERLLSIDFFRGFTMFLLIGEFTGLFGLLVSPEMKSDFIKFIGTQLHHHPWHGLHFWDLIQPFFMYIVGVAIPFSVAKRVSKGETRSKLLKHAITRSLLLLFFGWGLYCIDDGEISYRFQNVLAQLSVTYLLAFMIRDWKWSYQLLFSLFLLVATEIFYRTFHVAGFDQPFTPDKNFGAYIDMLISGQLSWGHWVSFNAIPTTAHTIWGVLTGKLLLSRRKDIWKISVLTIAALILLFSGYMLDNFTPIIKRISTSSFVLASGGWSLLAMALSYYLIDILKFRRGVWFFAVVGMNPLFIYLFAHIGGARLMNRVFQPFTGVLDGITGTLTADIINSLFTWAFLWYICYWLYRKKIFIKI